MSLYPPKAYKKEYDFSYATGPFLVFQLLETFPQQVQEVYISPDFTEKEKLSSLCMAMGIPYAEERKALERISSKEICYAACRFLKFSRPPRSDKNHVVLVNPSDMGNLGTVIRTLAAFSMPDLALIEPCADIFNPKTVRASMGALFKLRFGVYSSFEEYSKAAGEREFFPFMLDGAEVLSPAGLSHTEPFSLVFGNEAAGLPTEFAKLGRPVFIPQSKDVDSLNLAVSVAVGTYVFSHSGK